MGAAPRKEYVTHKESVAMHYFEDKVEYVMKLWALNKLEQVETENNNRPPTNYSYDEQPSILYEKLLFCRGKKKKKKYLMMYVQSDTYPS